MLGVRLVEGRIEAFGVLDVQGLVRRVVNDLILGEKAARDDRVSDRGGDPCEEVLDYRDRGEAREPIVEGARSGEDRVECSHLGPDGTSVDVGALDTEA